MLSSRTICLLICIAILGTSACDRQPSDLNERTSADGAITNRERQTRVGLQLSQEFGWVIVQPDIQLKETQAWREFQATDEWKSPRLATYAERQSAFPCIDKIEGDTRAKWEEPNFTLNRDSMRIGEWDDRSQIGFIEGSIAGRSTYTNSSLRMVDLSTCHLILAEYDSNTLDIRLVGDHEGAEVRVVYNNPRAWHKEIKFLPGEKKIYKRTHMDVDEVAFIDTPAAKGCSDILQAAQSDKPISQLCDIHSSDLNVTAYYEYLAVYDFGKLALRKYRETPKQLRPYGQRMMSLPVGDAVVSTYSKKYHATGTLPYPLELRHTFTTDFDAG